MSTTVHLIADERPEWQAHAECHLHPEIDFFPGRGEATKPAKDVCAICPARQACLDHAMANGERWGIWGGLSERERRRLRRNEPLQRAAMAKAILGAVADRGGRWPGTVRDLADSAGTASLATNVSTVRNLISAGLLEAERTGPRCTVALLLTPAGWATARPSAPGRLVKTARCPECNRGLTVATSATVFPEHTVEIAPAGPSMTCTGTDWLIEDGDLIEGRWPR